MNDINNQNIKKSINFDLDTNKLKEIYPNKNYTQAYDDIKRFLIKNGFEHTQGSGYISELANTINQKIKIWIFKDSIKYLYIFKNIFIYLLFNCYKTNL